MYAGRKSLDVVRLTGMVAGSAMPRHLQARRVARRAADLAAAPVAAALQALQALAAVTHLPVEGADIDSAVLCSDLAVTIHLAHCIDNFKGSTLPAMQRLG